MGRVKGGKNDPPTTVQKPPKKRAPARTPEARESQMIALAMDLAEQQLRDGTASSQVISHFLKLGASKEKLEKEIMEEQKKLLEAKTESLQSARRVEELYAEAMEAMKRYGGYSGVSESEED